MNGKTADQEPYDLAAVLYHSDLTATARRAVFDATVSSVIDSDLPSLQSVLQLIELAAERINGAEYRDKSWTV